MRQNSELLSTTVQIAWLLSCSIFLWSSMSYALYYSGYFDILPPDQNLSGDGGWNEPSNWERVKEPLLPDGNRITLTSADAGEEQIFRFSDPRGDQKPFVNKVRVSIYGIKVGSPSAFQVRICLAGCWLTSQTISMTTAYTWNYTDFIVPSGAPEWTIHQVENLRCGFIAPQIDVNNYYVIDTIRAYAVGDQDENYDGNLRLDCDEDESISLDDSDASFVGTSTYYDHSGERISGVGDINLDGVDDFIIKNFCDGMPYMTNAIHLVFGSSTLSASTSLSGYPSITHWEYQMSQAYNVAELSNCGDITGDGEADLLIGTPNLYPGYSFLFPGRSSIDWSSEMEWSTEWKSLLFGSQEDEMAGVTKGVGDINGDGDNDIVIGAPGYDKNKNEVNELENSGIIYIVFGPVTVPPYQYNLYEMLQIKGWSASQGLGFRVSPVGDVNNDEKSDFIMSNSTSAGPGKASKCYLVLGRQSNDPWSHTCTFVGENESDSAVFATSIGNFNGDEYDDIAIGAPNYNNGNGRIYIFLGRSSWVSGYYDIGADLIIDGDFESYLGEEIAKVGDLDGDGFDDMIVRGCQTVYLITGKGRDFMNHDQSYNPIPIPIAETADAIFYRWSVYCEYFSVAGIGDVNNDGFPDIAIGDIDAKNGLGETYVFYGGRN